MMKKKPYGRLSVWWRKFCLDVYVIRRQWRAVKRESLEKYGPEGPTWHEVWQRLRDAVRLVIKELREGGHYDDSWRNEARERCRTEAELAALERRFAEIDEIHREMDEYESLGPLSRLLLSKNPIMPWDWFDYIDQIKRQESHREEAFCILATLLWREVYMRSFYYGGDFDWFFTEEDVRRCFSDAGIPFVEPQFRGRPHRDTEKRATKNCRQN